MFCGGGALFQKDKQDSSGSLEAINDPIPQPMPFPPTAVRSSSPKLDPSEVYLKSKTIYEDKREYFSINLEILKCDRIFPVLFWHFLEYLFFHCGHRTSLKI